MQTYMGQDDIKTPKGVKGSNLNSIFLAVIIKTTIFMFVPTLGLFAVGAAVDHIFKTTPIGMLVGVALGFVIAIVLIIRLIRKQKKQSLTTKQENGK